MNGQITRGTNNFYKRTQLSHTNEKLQMESLKKTFVNSVVTQINDGLKNDTTPQLLKSS